MLPNGYSPDAPLMFQYWEKTVQKELAFACGSGSRQWYFILTSERIPEPFLVGLN